MALIGLFWVPESPVYLYNMFRFDECREVLLKIATRNRIKNVDDFTNFYFDVEDDHKKSKLATITAV